MESTHILLYVDTRKSSNKTWCLIRKLNSRKCNESNYTNETINEEAGGFLLNAKNEKTSKKKVDTK